MDKFKIIINSLGLQHIKPVFYSNGTPLKVKDANINNITVVEPVRFDIGRDLQRKSLLGSAVFSDLILSYDNMELYFDIALIEVTQKKNIVSTKIVGRDGTVKEFINNDDYSITIDAILHSNQIDVFPASELELLNKLSRVNDAVNCISPFLDLFDVFAMVIDDLKVKQNTGKLDTLSVTIKGKSDNYLSIFINE